MAAILSITAAEVGRIARLDVVGDDVAAADVAGVIDDEQTAIEALIDPAAFAISAIADLLRRNVAKLLAAEVLEMRRRQAGAAGDLQIGTGSSEVKISKVPDFPAFLRIEANAALKPYLRKHELVNHALTSLVAPAVSGSSSADQNALFGPDETDRDRGMGRDTDPFGRW